MRALFLLLLLTGCAGTRVIDPSTQQPLPFEDMQPCVKATQLKDPSFKAYLEKIDELSSRFKECSKKQENLSNYIKQNKQ